MVLSLFNRDGDWDPSWGLKPAMGDKNNAFYFKITIGNGEGDKRRDDQLSDSRSRGSRCLFWWK